MNRAKLGHMDAVFWGVILIALFVWFLRTHRARFATSFVVRHLGFFLCVYFGMLWISYEEQITTLIFGHVVYKDSPQEFPAVLVILGGVIFWFAIAVLILGKNRRLEFERYVEAFPILRKFIRK
jgi:hypothetical protein